MIPYRLNDTLLICWFLSVIPITRCFFALNSLIQKIFSTRLAALNFCTVLLIAYAILPASVYLHLIEDPYFIELALVTILAVAMITVGYFFPMFDSRFAPSAKRLQIDARFFHTFVWASFLAFVIITIATAEAVPIISALQGASAEVLDEQRGQFLKARVGSEVIFGYLSTLFVSALLPYSLVDLFINRQRFRYLLLLIFLCYSISFLQKALFINVLVPLIYINIVRGKINFAKMLFAGIGSIAFLYLITRLAFGNNDDAFSLVASAPIGDFFGAAYLPTGPIDHLIWRSTAVPMFTAADTLRVFAEQFEGKPLWGATSSFFSGLLSIDRVPLEKLVYEYQWGWNDTGNANSVFITEAFVNFGLVGVLFFSLFVGQTLRWFRLSNDQAFKSLWPIYCFAIFSSGLIGTMLSNGYTFMFFLALCIHLKPCHNQLKLIIPAEVVHAENSDSRCGITTQVPEN